MTDQGPDNAPTPKSKVYTPEEKAEILRKMRRASIMMDIMLWLLAIAVVMGFYLQTGSETVAIVIGVPVFGYLLYHTYKQIRLGRD